jgi:autotransporter-associated beta strand protein
MIRTLSRSAIVFGALIPFTAGIFPAAASAQSGTWITNAAGTYNWSDAGNWQTGVIADGANSTATFATAGLTGPMTVNLDSPRTIGSLVFDNPTNNFNWTVNGGNPLTLGNASGPSIAVNNANITATVPVALAGTQGFRKIGPGTVFLTGNNTGLSGGITVAAGVLGVTANGSTNPLGSTTITLGGGTLRLGDGSGFNQRMVVPVGTTFANSGITATMEGGTSKVNYTWYALGQNAAAPLTGLPSGTTVTSLAGSTFTYALPAANTTTNNCLMFDTAHPTGRLVLAAPTAGLSQISFLTSSGNAGTAATTVLPTITATIHYADGTHDATATFRSPDWFTTTTSGLPATPAVGASGVISSTGGAITGSYPNLFDESIVNPNPSSLVSNIDMSWVTGSATTTHTVVMALGAPGAAIPIAGPNGAQTFTNNVAVSADSTINIQTPAGAGLGNLTIGPNTLNVTAGGQAGATLTLGAVSMTGDPIFKVASGIILTTTGAFTDGGIVRNVTSNGPGTFTVTGASPSLQPGTRVTITAGTLNLNNATAFGPSPAVAVTGGTLNVGPGINPTFASLSGTGGVLTLNGNTLIFGDGTGAYSGTISGGAGSLVKTGGGTQTLTGTNSYTGGTSINAGTVAASPGALGTGAVTLAGGTLAIGPTFVPNGFGGHGTGWTTNGTASFPQNNVLQVISSAAGSAWLNTPIATVGPFIVKFTVNDLTSGTGGGLTVGLQNSGLAALGIGGFGYTGITPSAVLALNLNPANTQGGVGSGIGVLTNGASPSTIEPMPSTAPVNAGLANQPTNVTLTYDGANLTAAMVQGAASYSSPPLPLNISGAVGATGFFGFTAGAPGVLFQLQISNFTFSSVGYNSPTTPVPGNYANNVIVANSSTIQVTAPVGVPTVTMGTLTMGAATTLTVSPDPTNPAGAPFGLAFASTALNGANTMNEVATGTLSLGLLTSVGSASLTVVGGGSLAVAGGAIPGRLSLGSSNLSLGGTSLTAGSLAGTGGTLSGNATAPIILTIGSDNSSTTYGGAIIDGGTGSLALNKTGTGTLMLTGTNTYSGGTVISDGILSVVGDATVGTGSVTITALGTLSYSATTTSNKTFTLGGGTLAVGVGATLTLNGSQISSGFLGGAGTFATDPINGTRFANVNSLPSAAITSNSPSDQFLNFTNNGTFSVPAGVNTTGANTTVNLRSFTNQGSGSVTIGAGSRVNIADFQSTGTLTMNPATVSGRVTTLTNAGTAPLAFNGGSRTFIGTPATAANDVTAVDLHGQNAVVNGSLFVNNGLFLDSSTGGPGTVVVGFGAMVRGAGTYQNPVITQNGGTFQAGDSIGTARFGKFVFGPGGVSNYAFAIDDATGTPGPNPDSAGHVSGWGLVRVVQQAFAAATSSGDFTWTATATTKLTVALDTLVNPTAVGTEMPGASPMDHFDPTQQYMWPAVRWAGNYSGPTDPTALNSATVFNTSGFLNPTAGTFGWNLDTTSQTLSLVYTPSSVPEPGTLGLIGVAAAGFALRRRYSRTRV